MTYKVLLKDGKFDADNQLGTVAAQQNTVKNAIQRAAAENKPLVLHLHGGLVKRSSGEEIADRLQADYSAAGGVPLFFVWQTGLIETIRTNYMEALKGRLIKWALGRLLRKLAGKLNVPVDQLATRSIDSDTEFSAIELQSFETELMEDAEFDVIATSLVNAVNAEVGDNVPEPAEFRSLLTTPGLADEETKREAATLDANLFVSDDTKGTRGVIDTLSFKWKVIKAIGETLLGVVRRYRNHTEHTTHATIIEELSRRIHGDYIGAEIWGFMKTDSRQAFNKGNQYAGDFFLKCLEQSNPRPRVVIVAHSAGAVFTCHLLTAASTGPFDLAFLAPAVTSHLFDKTVTNHGTKIANFRMFTMHDPLERADALINSLPKLYPSSLLYLIAGILELDEDRQPDIDKPILGMERFYSTNYRGRKDDHPMLARVRDWLNGKPNQIVWSKSVNGPGLGTESADHGDFDNDDATVKSLKHIIQNGY